MRHFPDVLDCIANLSNDEVFTSPSLVNKILDLLPEDVWTKPELKWLDPACKTGVFLREIARRLWIGLKNVIPDEQIRKNHIYKNMLWGIAITELTSYTSRRSLYYSKFANSKNSIVSFENIMGNISYENIEHEFKRDICIHCGTTNTGLVKKINENQELYAYNFLHKRITDIFEGKEMKFDVIIGNPPYQINDGGHGASASPLYHRFIEEAKKLNPRYISMIIPARWYAGGKGLDNFRESMLNDKRIKTLVDFTDSNECFPGVEVKGGICYFLWDREHNDDCTVYNGNEAISRKLNEYPTFIRFNKAISIVKKINHINNLSEVVLGRNPFGIATNFKEYDNNYKNGYVKLYGRNFEGFLDKSKIKKNIEIIDKFKVIIPKAGEGDGSFPNRILGRPFIIEPNTCCTETYLVAGFYDSLEEAQNYEKYLKTKFVRFLISLSKYTQDTTKDKFIYVPNLNMKEDWNDIKLYKKFDLNTNEISFIEEMIKEM